MSKTAILFVQGGGQGAHRADAPLADSLQRALGGEYDVHFPRMPNEADPSLESWQPKISSALSRLPGKVILVVHSIGGAIVLRFLSEQNVAKPIAGLFLLAVPSWDADRWNFADLKLVVDIGAKLAVVPRLFLYHCRDDEVVPFAHLALHAARLPRAVVRALDRGGHQFGNDLSGVAADIRGDEAA